MINRLMNRNYTPKYILSDLILKTAKLCRYTKLGRFKAYIFYTSMRVYTYKLYRSLFYYLLIQPFFGENIAAMAEISMDNKVIL